MKQKLPSEEFQTELSWEEAVARYFVGVADVQGYRVSDSVWDRRPVDALRDLRWMAESSGRAGVGPAS